MRNSLVPVMPCVVLSLFATSRLIQPHELIRPWRKWVPRTIVLFPQSHSHNHVAIPVFVLPPSAITVSLPNRFPTIGTILDILSPSSLWYSANCFIAMPMNYDHFSGGVFRHQPHCRIKFPLDHKFPLFPCGLLRILHRSPPCAAEAVVPTISLFQAVHQFQVRQQARDDHKLSDLVTDLEFVLLRCVVV